MGLISCLYKKNFVGRYDKQIGVPYYFVIDFKGLKQDSNEFINSKGIKIKYFYYFYDGYKQDKVVLFLPGIGPGHTAYMKEIDELAKHGYKILTLDYTGCDKSEGKGLGSLNTPTDDVIDLLDYLKLDRQIVLVGHSLGGYTSLNILNMRKDIEKGVILSGFLSINSLIKTSSKSKLVLSSILRYERKTCPKTFELNNYEFLKNTEDNLLFIHSKDDPVVLYKDTIGYIEEELHKPNIKIISVDKRGHNPNYSESAAIYLNEVFGKYNQLVKSKKIKTDEDRINYFKDVSLERLVKQDENIIEQIVKFIN